MKILWFNWRDIRNPDAGGAEVFTHEVCKRLVKMGHEVTLFTSRFEGAKSEDKIEGITIIRGGGRFSVYREAKAYAIKNSKKFDLIIDEINTRPFLTPTFANGIPIIALIHQLAREYWFYETSFPLNVLGYFFLERYWLMKYRDIPTITVSKSTKLDLEKMSFHKVHMVPEGLDVEPLNSPAKKETKPTLIFVGRFKKVKRPDHAIMTFNIVKKEFPDAQLWMVGDGYMMDELKRMAGDGITFFGRISNEEKLELMKRAHVLLMPGVREGWGLVVTEANAMGTPAIAYDVPGLRDSVVDKVTGMLVVPGDYVAMAIAATALLKDNDKMSMYSSNAIKWAKRFSWDNTAKEFLRIIQLYVERRKPGDMHLEPVNVARICHDSVTNLNARPLSEKN